MDSAIAGTASTDRLLNPKQVADRLGVSERWVRDHATRRSPRIAVVRLGPLVRFRSADIESFLENLRDDHTVTKRRR